MSFVPQRGPPLKAGPRRKPNGTTPEVNNHQPPTSANQQALKTGGLDRDGIWRPNRGSIPSSRPTAVDAAPPRPHTLTFPPIVGETLDDFLYNDRRVQSPFQSTAPGMGYEVPIFVAPVRSAGPPLRRALSPAGMGGRRGEC